MSETYPLSLDDFSVMLPYPSLLTAVTLTSVIDSLVKYSVKLKVTFITGSNSKSMLVLDWSSCSTLIGYLKAYVSLSYSSGDTINIQSPTGR